MKTVTIVVPVYNEQNFIENCLTSIRGFTIPDGWGLAEIFVVDGGSKDATCEIVRQAIATNKHISFLPNPGRIQATALNIALRKASGDFILRLDAHAVYPKDYLLKSIEVATSTHSDNVGGIVITVPGGDRYGALLVQALTTHKFGVGDSGFRLGARGELADTVPYGFFRRDIFGKIGFFDERLVRAEDYEMNRRIILAGGVVWRDPDIKARYFNKASLRAFLKKQLFIEAPYNAYLWFLAPYAFAWRHSIAALFVLGNVFGLLLWPWVLGREIYLSILGLYAFLACMSSIQQAVKFCDWRHVFALPFCFLSYHLSYGVGVLWGLLRLVTGTAPVQKIAEPWKGAGQFRAESFVRRNFQGTNAKLKPHTDLGECYDKKVLGLRNINEEHHELTPRSVSIIIPALNEEDFLGKCLASVGAFHLPAGWTIAEILLLDGGGQDVALDAIRKTRQKGPGIIVIPNPRKIQSIALNLAIPNATGDFILRLDAHAAYPNDYLEKCIQAWIYTGADNVGGLFVTTPRGEGYEAKLIQALTTHRFGVGDSGFRVGDGPGIADTVPYGFFKKDLFYRLGLFDERLVRAQDYEMNRRIAMAGGCVWRDPAIKVQYYNQASFFSFLEKQFDVEAPYNVYMWYLAPYAFAWRHGITGLFVLGLVTGLVLWPLSLVRSIYLPIIGLYVLLAISSAIQQSYRYRDWRHIFTLPFCFLAYHLVHGVGVVIGLLRLAAGTSPVQKSREPWSGAGQFNAWPPPNSRSWELDKLSPKKDSVNA